MNPELVFYSASSLLESPVWSERHQSIFCVSIDDCLIYQIQTNGFVKTFKTAGPVGCVVVNENGDLVSAEKEGVFLYCLESGSKKFINHFEANNQMRYNDGKLDPRGRFLVGTKGWKEEYLDRGNLYSYNGEQVKVIIDKIGISNGIGFNSDGSKMYFIDTITKKVALYNYCLDSGDASFERYIIEIPGSGYPDGMCVDIDNNLWVAEWEGGKVCKWDPHSGLKLAQIYLPCDRVTSCCLGGQNLEYLYITTARNPQKMEQMAGGLFKIKLR